MSTPAREYMRYGEVLSWFEQLFETGGPSKARKLIENGTIKGVKIAGWTNYSRSQIQAEILDKFNSPPAGGPASTGQREAKI